MKYAFLIFFALVIAATAKAQSPWYFGTGEAVNLTNGTAFKNGVKNIAGSLNPSSTAVSAPSGSMYFSTSGTIYVKQDVGLSTNWLPLGIATTGSLTTINGQSGPGVNIASGTSGSDFAVSAASNTITLNLPTASAIARGALSSTDWSLFNAKEPAVTATTSADYYRGDKTFQPLNKAAVGLSNVDNTSDAAKPISTATQAALNLKEDSIAAGTTSQYWRGDKSWQTLDKSAVGLSNVDNTSDANKPVSTATQTAINAKIDGVASSVDSEVVLYSGTTGKASKRATGSGYAKLTSGVLSTSATVATSDLSGQVALANGGTNKNMTAVNGGVVYTDADSQEVSAAGTSGQILKSNGAAAPTWVNKSISGKAENLTSVTAETIVVPNNQLANVGNNNEQLIETGNKNLLRNAGFEAFDGPFWTSTGSIAIGNNPLFGKAEAVVSITASDLSFYQDSTLNAAQFADGIQGLASVWVKTSITSTPIYVCPRKAGVTTVSTSACVTVQANGKWGLYKVPFILGGTSNGIDVTSNSVSISSGSISIDEAFVGPVDLKQDINVVGPWQSYTPTLTGFGAATGLSFRWRQVGGSVEIEGKFTSGTATATEARITLPSSYTAISTISTLTVVGMGAYGLNTPATSYMLAEPSVNYLTMSVQSSTSSGLSKATGSATTGNTGTFSFTASVPVNELSGASSVYTAQNADTDWASCGHTTSDFTGFGTVTNIETQCKRQGSDLLMRGKFNSGTSTAVEGRVNLKLAGTALTSANTTKIPTLQKAGDITFNIAFSGSSSVLIEPSVGYFTFGLSSTSTAGLTKANGSSVLASGNSLGFEARIPINGWDNSNVIIGTFNEVPTNPGVTKPVVFGASVTASCTSTPCTITNNGTTITSISRSTTGTYAINMTGLSATPICSFNSQETTAGNSAVTCHRSTTRSSTVYNFTCKQGTAFIDYHFEVTCLGQAP